MDGSAGMKRRLTDRQLEIMAYVCEFSRKNGRVPTSSYIAKHFGFTYDNAQEYLAQFTRRGYLERVGHGKYEFAQEASNV